MAPQSSFKFIEIKFAPFVFQVWTLRPRARARPGRCGYTGEELFTKTMSTQNTSMCVVLFEKATDQGLNQTSTTVNKQVLTRS